MKKFLVTAVVLVTVISLALIPGMDKRRYGGDVSLLLFPGIMGLGFGGYYMEGMQVYNTEDIYVDVFAGPSFSFGYVSVLSSTSGFTASLGINANVLAYKESISFEAFGYKIIPAAMARAGVFWNIAGVDILKEYYGEERTISFDWGLSVTLIVPWGEGRYVSFYFWPYPIMIGVDVIEM